MKKTAFLVGAILFFILSVLAILFLVSDYARTLSFKMLIVITLLSFFFSFLSNLSIGAFSRKKIVTYTYTVITFIINIVVFIYILMQRMTV